MKKTRAQKSRATVPLSVGLISKIPYIQLFFENLLKVHKYTHVFLYNKSQFHVTSYQLMHRDFVLQYICFK
jgi:hypothetical protein